MKQHNSSSFKSQQNKYPEVQIQSQDKKNSKIKKIVKIKSMNLSLKALQKNQYFKKVMNSMINKKNQSQQLPEDNHFQKTNFFSQYNNYQATAQNLHVENIQNLMRNFTIKQQNKSDFKYAQRSQNFQDLFFFRDQTKYKKRQFLLQKQLIFFPQINEQKQPNTQHQSQNNEKQLQRNNSS